MGNLSHPNRDQLQLDHVLTALGNQIRLLVVSRLACADELTCGEALPEISKSTASHHWRVLRESGLIRVRAEGRAQILSLRRADLDERFPGLLDAVLDAVPAERDLAAAVRND